MSATNRNNWDQQLYDPHPHRTVWEEPEVGIDIGKLPDITIAPGQVAEVRLPPQDADALLSGPGWSVRIHTPIHGGQLNITVEE